MKKFFAIVLSVVLAVLVCAGFTACGRKQYTVTYWVGEPHNFYYWTGIQYYKYSKTVYEGDTFWLVPNDCDFSTIDTTTHPLNGTGILPAWNLYGNYSFCGWYFDEDFEIAWKYENKITSDVVLYAYYGTKANCQFDRKTFSQR